ncbi:hypothetical protein, partial [Snodgrassella alvi]
MLGTSPLNTTLLATDTGEAVQAETNRSTELIRIGCTVRAIVEQSGDLIAITCNVYQRTESGGDLL